MSADNMIFVQQNSKNRWVAQHWFSSNDGKPDPEVVPYGDTYASLQLCIEMNRERARETEYGFNINEGAYVAIYAEREENDTFKKELAQLLNKYSKESESGTPDFILAEYLAQQLSVWNNSMAARAVWRQESFDLPLTTRIG